MTHKELLELAAKAAEMDTFGFAGLCEPWNPLTNDGDALRLAVKLDLLWENMELFDMHFSHKREDKYMETRQAIVRAAAEIGKTL